MDFGIILADQPTRVREADHLDSILRQVEAAQRAGMNHILIGQHFLFPESRWLQPVPLLARLAAEVGPEVKLVTQVMIAPLYHPVMLAEELATLDVVTEGRLRVGLGLGYLRKEYEVFGIPFEERMARFEECVELLKLLWTSDRVTFAGRFWSLDDVPVHIRPVQQPHPPIWIGAVSDPGVRRAARLGDAWPIPPKLGEDELEDRLRLYAGLRAEEGKAVGQLPLRREIVVAADREQALERAVEMCQPVYLHMATVGNRHLDPARVASEIRSVVEDHFVLGTAAECAEQLRALGARFPVNPVIARASWPLMSTEDSVAYIEGLGEELVPSLRDYEPVAAAAG